MRVSWKARRSDQSTLKEINPEYPLEGLMLKLKRQWLWPLNPKSQLFGKGLDAGEDGRQKEKGGDRGRDG